jgi:hypothetical protein
MAKQKREEEATEPTINCFQACNHFKITERRRRVTFQKHEGDNMTISAWEEILKSERLLK